MRVDEEVRRAHSQLHSKHSQDVDQLTVAAQQRLATVEASELRWRSDCDAKSREVVQLNEALLTLRVSIVPANDPCWFPVFVTAVFFFLRCRCSFLR